MSLIGSVMYGLAKEHARILSPLVGSTKLFVRKSAEVVERIRKEIVDPRDVMVSFDVVNLFTKVPLTDTLQYISDLLASNNTLEERASNPAHDICQLVELCPRAT